MDITKLKELAKDLPKTHKDNAEALLMRMEAVVEGIGDRDIGWKPSLLRLVQGTTDRGSIPKGTAIGDIVVGEQKVAQPFKFILLRVWDGRQYWSPDQTDTKLLCSSMDGKLGLRYGYCNRCAFGKWNDVENRSECGKTKNIIAISHDFSDIFSVTFAKTNFKCGMELENAARKAGVQPYHRTYALSSQTNTKFKNIENFSVALLSDDQKVTPEALIPFLTELFAMINTNRKDALEGFYEYALTNAQANTPALDAPAESKDVVLLEAQGEQSEQPEQPEAATSSMAKKYEV
jgi:hypothetical protein